MGQVENPNWVEWIKFFLSCSILQADHYINKLEKIEKLYEEMLEISEKHKIRTDLVKYIFKSPVFDISTIQKN